MHHSADKVVTVGHAMTEKYKNMGRLNVTQSKILLHMQQKAKWQRMARYMSVLLLLIAGFSASVFVWNQYNQTDLAFENLAMAAIQDMNHDYEHMPMSNMGSTRSIDVAMVKSHFQFADVQMITKVMQKAQIIKYGECYLMKVAGMHLIVKDMKTGTYHSLYQFPYNKTNQALFKVKFSDNKKKYKYQTDNMEVGISLNQNVLTVMVENKKGGI